MAPNFRAAQYIRMSTERQDISVELQAAANAAFAAEKGYDLIATYCDEGISGLNFEKRVGLKRLITDVTSGVADYSIVLVYDVSRWGRFQNPDEAAHYEFLCAEAGVAVEYAAEPFRNDGSTSSSLLKAVKRIMAAEYSRELSARTRAALRTSASRGYWTGGSAGYGFRREVEDKAGRKRGVRGFAEPREQGTHTRLVVGPPHEVATVRRIYRDYVSGGLSLKGIAERLNCEGNSSESGRPWTWTMVQTVLTSEKYMGRIVRCKTQSGLGRAATRTEPEHWQRVEGTTPALVTRRLWAEAQAERKRRREGPTRAELVADIERLAKHHAFVTVQVLRERGRYRMERYCGEFGSVVRAVEAAGCAVNARQKAAYQRCLRLSERGRAAAEDDARILRALRRLYVSHGRLTRRLMREDRSVPDPSTYVKHFGSLARAFALVGFQPTRGQARMMMPSAFWTYPGEGTELARAANAAAQDGFTPDMVDARFAEQLAAVLKDRGRLSRAIIDHARGIPNAQALVDRFGSLERVYQLAGYAPTKHQLAMIAARRRSRADPQ